MSEGTPVLDGNPPERGGTSVLLGIPLDVDVSESLELVDVAIGNRSIARFVELKDTTPERARMLTRRWHWFTSKWSVHRKRVQKVKNTHGRLNCHYQV